MTSERPREHLVAAKADVRSNKSYLPAARQKLVRSALEPQAEGILFRRFTQHIAKNSVQVERRPSSTVGKDPKGPRTEDHILNNFQKLMPSHGYIIDSMSMGA